jgi:hypothetical protein
VPTWAWVVIAILAGAAVIASSAYLGWGAWKRYTQRVVLRLVSRRESLRSGRQSFAEVLAFLAAADDEMLQHFASDHDELHRRVLDDVAIRAAMTRDELDTMPLPASLRGAAESLADAAWFLATEAGRVGGAPTEAEAFRVLSTLDLAPMNQAFADADADLDRACKACEVEDTMVYGGGLYV